MLRCHMKLAHTFNPSTLKHRQAELPAKAMPGLQNEFGQPGLRRNSALKQTKMSCGTGQLPLLGGTSYRLQRQGWGVGETVHKFEAAGLVKNQGNWDLSAWQLRWAAI